MKFLVKKIKFTITQVQTENFHQAFQDYYIGQCDPIIEKLLELYLNDI